MNLPTNEHQECYAKFMNLLKQGTPQFHDNEPLPPATSWIFQTNFINIFSLCGGFRLLNFVPPRFPSCAFLLLLGSSLSCAYLKASSLWRQFFFGLSLQFLKAIIQQCPLILWLDYCTSNQATRTQCSWNAQSHGFESMVIRSYKWHTGLCRIQILWNWFYEVLNMGMNSWICLQHVIYMVEISSKIVCLYSELGPIFQWIGRTYC